MNISTGIVSARFPMAVKRFLPQDAHSVTTVIIAAHGFGGDMESSAIRALAETLCPRGAAVLAFDFPAHGKSPLAEDALTVDVCCAHMLDMAAYAASEYPDAAYGVFATSFGGYIALLCSRALAELLPGCRFVYRAPAVNMAFSFLDQIVCSAEAEFAARGAVRTGYDREMLVPYSFYTDLVRHSALCPQPENGLILYGERDTVVRRADIDAFLLLNPHVRLHIVPGADHRFKGEGQLEEVVREAQAYYFA